MSIDNKPEIGYNEAMTTNQRYTVVLSATYSVWGKDPKEILEYVEGWGTVPEITDDHYPNVLEDVDIQVKDSETGKVLATDWDD